MWAVDRYAHFIAKSGFNRKRFEADMDTGQHRYALVLCPTIRVQPVCVLCVTIGVYPLCNSRCVFPLRCPRCVYRRVDGRCSPTLTVHHYNHLSAETQTHTAVPLDPPTPATTADSETPNPRSNAADWTDCGVITEIIGE